MSKKIVCLGWGSLCWDPGTLPVDRCDWASDGPSLPVEFTRVSNDKRVTLAITPDASDMVVLWKALNVDSLDHAITALAEREKIKEKNIKYSVGYWSTERESDHAEVSKIATWATSMNFDSVVWTALKPRYQEESGHIPTIEQVLESLDGLSGETRTAAERYVRCAPSQIATSYRKAIEKKLGWTSTDPQKCPPK